MPENAKSSPATNMLPFGHSLHTANSRRSRDIFPNLHTDVMKATDERNVEQGLAKGYEKRAAHRGDEGKASDKEIPHIPPPIETKTGTRKPVPRSTPLLHRLGSGYRLEEVEFPFGYVLLRHPITEDDIRQSDFQWSELGNIEDYLDSRLCGAVTSEDHSHDDSNLFLARFMSSSALQRVSVESVTRDQGEGISEAELQHVRRLLTAVEARLNSPHIRNTDANRSSGHTKNRQSGPEVSHNSDQQLTLDEALRDPFIMFYQLVRHTDHEIDVPSSPYHNPTRENMRGSWPVSQAAQSTMDADLRQESQSLLSRRPSIIRIRLHRLRQMVSPRRTSGRRSPLFPSIDSLPPSSPDPPL